MKSKKVAKVKRNGSSTVRLTTRNATRDDPALRALAKELTARFMADTAPEKQSPQALDEFWADFEKEFVAELRAEDAADAAADASPIRRAEKKNKIRTERAGKRF